MIGLMSLTNHRKMEKKANKTSGLHRHEKIKGAEFNHKTIADG